MATLPALLVATLLSAAGETALLEFAAPWCAPCSAMEPVVSRLEAEGLPIHRVNIDQHPEFAQQHRVESIPCFVMIVQGREVDRVTGSTSYERLCQMVSKAAAGSNSADARRSGTAVPWPQDGPIPQRPLTQPASQVESAQAAGGVVAELLAATVRIRVADAKGASYGSGTIVDMHEQEALVLTCGHLFRESTGQGKVTVDLFIGGQPRSIPAQLVRYDLKRDLGLVSCRPGVPVKPIQVASRDRIVQVGETMWVTGCDRGGGPFRAETRVVSIDKYIGLPNIQVAGLPPDGRSGGGLFTVDGQLVGICNAADEIDQQGLYAALPAIQGELDQAGLSFVYQADRLVPAASLASNATQSPERSSLGESALHDAEVICIVRSKNDSQKSQVFVLENASPGLIKQLALEMSHKTKAIDVTLPLIRSGNAKVRQAVVPQNVVRGQSPPRWKR